MLISWDETWKAESKVEEIWFLWSQAMISPNLSLGRRGRCLIISLTICKVSRLSKLRTKDWVRNLWKVCWDLESTFDYFHPLVASGWKSNDKLWKKLQLEFKAETGDLWFKAESFERGGRKQVTLTCPRLQKCTEDMLLKMSKIASTFCSTLQRLASVWPSCLAKHELVPRSFVPLMPCSLWVRCQRAKRRQTLPDESG